MAAFAPATAGLEPVANRAVSAQEFEMCYLECIEQAAVAASEVEEKAAEAAASKSEVVASRAERAKRAGFGCCPISGDSGASVATAAVAVADFAVVLA